MAISAQRFKFLDRETNIPVFNFTDLADNAIYNTVDTIATTAIESIIEEGTTLDSLYQGADELAEILQSSSSDASKKLDSALNTAIKDLFSMDLPSAAADALTSLKSLDFNGLKGFIKDNLGIGNPIYCINTGSLMLSFGNFPNGNILSGLLFSLLFSWLDRLCNQIDKIDLFQIKDSTKIDLILPTRGIDVSPDSAFGLFKSYSRDFIKSKSPINIPIPLTPSDFISSVLSNNIDSAIDNLRNAEISSSLKDTYLDEIVSNLSNYMPGSSEYNNLLNARAMLSKIPMINSERRDNIIEFEHVGDKLGSFFKGIADIDINPLNTFTSSSNDINLFNKFTTLKDTLSNNTDLMTRDNSSGSFIDFDFDSILPSFTSDEETYLLSDTSESDSHRLHDIHPTTERFLYT